MRRIGVLVMAGALAFLLAGCIAPTVHKVAPTVTPTPAPTPEVVVTVPNGVMASGSFRSPDGSTAGQFEIVNSDGLYSLTFSHFHSSIRDGLSVSFADSSPRVGQCFDGTVNQVTFADTLTARSAARTWTAADSDQSNLAWTDPSFLKDLVVGLADGSGCGASVIAAGKLAWRIPETHPDIRIVDHGVSYSAWGKATVKDGKPFTYLTHQGDDWTHIAKRFNITKADLTWLNPVRTGGNNYQVAYIDQVLNLDPDNRGNSESRRHPE